MEPKRRWKRRWLVALVATLVALIGLGIWLGPTAWTAYHRGFLDSAPERTYTGTQVENLKALRTALMLYEQSEDAFPPADRWMDAIENRIQSSDMARSEADKKLNDPSLKGANYGWAMNEALGSKHKEDIKDPQTPVLFSSSDTSRNAHGDPAKLTPKPPRPGGNIGISLDGTILHLP